MDHTNRILQAWMLYLQGEKIVGDTFITASSIQEIVIKYNLKTSSRKTKYIEQRQALIKYLYFELNWSLERIGELLNKNHTTILHCVKKIKSGTYMDYTYLSNTLKIRNTINFYNTFYRKNKLK